MYLGNQPALSYTSFAKQDFTTSATTAYTLSQPVANENEIALFINFVRQEPTTAYTASGTSLTLTSATSASDDMYAIFLGKAVQTVNPPAGSVNTSQLADTSVTPAKLNLNDNLLFNTANKGIYLGVTSATASNLLDDYEEGTWTPTMTASGGGSATLNTPVANYVKVGKIVHIQMRITTTAFTLSGDVTVSGLPFTSDSTTNHQTALSVQGFRFLTDMPNLSAYILNNTNEITLDKSATNATSRSYLTNSDMTGGTNKNTLILGGSYEVS